GPAVEGARRTLLVVGREVPLADRRGGVAAVAQDARARGGVARPVRVVAREAAVRLGDHPEADAVMVAAREQRGARGRAQRGDVEAVVAQALLGEPVERGRADRAAEGGGI